METVESETTTTPNNSSNNVVQVTSQGEDNSLLKKSMKKRNLGLCNQELLQLIAHQSEWMAADNCKNRKKEAKALQTVSFLSQKAFAFIKIPCFNSSWQGENAKNRRKL